MKRTFVLFLALLAVLSLSVAAVSAVTLTYSGTIDPENDPFIQPMVIVDPPDCTGGMYNAPIHYHTYSLSVAETGTYTINGLNGEEGIYIYNGSFNPSDPATNCYKATVWGTSISFTLTAGTTYTVVVWEDGLDQDGMTYNFTIDGPEQQTPDPTSEVTPDPTSEVTPDPTQEVTPDPTSEVTPDPTSEVTPDPTQEVTPDPTSEVTPDPTDEPTPEVTPDPTDEPIVVPTGTPVPVVATPQPCLYPFPTGASVYFVPQGAPTFYQPNLETQNSFNLPAGSWYITEIDDEDDFGKVWIACRAAPVYIPLNAIDLPVIEDAE